MANKNVFKSSAHLTPPAEILNSAGGKAYEMSAKQALAQLACTNCFNGTFYASAEDNLKLAKDVALKLKSDPEFIAKAAIYSRNKGYMKDMPAFLTAVLAATDTKLFRKVFNRVIDNGKMLGNFVMIGRSGQAGRVLNMSSAAVRHAIGEWFASRNSDQIFRGSVGIDPSMRDILRMAHPRPDSAEKAALFAYLKGSEFDKETRTFKTYKDVDGKKVVAYEHSFDVLPELVRAYELFKATREGNVPKVDFRLLDSLNLTDSEWTEVARNAGWTMTRMNLNTFNRHSVFKDKEMVKLIAARLRNPEEITKARAFPYQLMAAWRNIESDIPFEIRDALQDAMEVAVDNVPTFDGQIYIAIDTSGSMSSPVTGYRKGSSSAVSCVDVAALFAASIQRKNHQAHLLPFDTSVHDASKLNPRDTVLTNSEKLARFGGGGTNCSCALALLNAKQAKGDAVIYISDYESWVDSGAHYYGSGQGTMMLSEWDKFSRRNHNAKLICMDLTPRGNSQVKERKNILQVGGFNDAVFEVVKSFIERGNEVNHWVAEIEKINLDAD